MLAFRGLTCRMSSRQGRGSIHVVRRRSPTPRWVIGISTRTPLDSRPVYRFGFPLTSPPNHQNDWQSRSVDRCVKSCSSESASRPIIRFGFYILSYSPVWQTRPRHPHHRAGATPPRFFTLRCGLWGTGVRHQLPSDLRLRLRLSLSFLYI